MWDTLFIDVNLATMRDGRYAVIADGAIGIDRGLIAWIGPKAALPGPVKALARSVYAMQGAWMTPGLIDCHTHLVYGGNRAREFELRLQGASYEEIARSGGGIVSTVAQTRGASSQSLLASARERLRDLAREGVTTVEVKSGYGLDTETEIKTLRVARALAHEAPVTIKTSFLGAHALPPEFQGRPDDYIRLVTDVMLPAVAREGLADAVDAFCEGIGFTPEQTARVFECSRALGLPVKLHADQLSDLGGAALAARFGALSADHLEHTSEAGVRAMAAAGTVAVLLPGAYYFIRETKSPPIAALREHRVPIAISTDCNPGSSPVTSILLMLNMACTLFRLTPEEALAGVTVHAARALGIGATHGTLALGKQADLALWRIDAPAELAYAIGRNRCIGVVKAGGLLGV